MMSLSLAAVLRAASPSVGYLRIRRISCWNALCRDVFHKNAIWMEVFFLFGRKEHGRRIFCQYYVRERATNSISIVGLQKVTRKGPNENCLSIMNRIGSDHDFLDDPNHGSSGPPYVKRPFTYHR